MNVGQILKVKGRSVVFNRASTAIDEIIRELPDYKIGAVVIVDGNGRVARIVSEGDIMRLLAQQGASALIHPAISVMTVE